MGVTYYKLEQRYEGDVTKGCGLTSAEVDKNFHFLRGYDIKDATLTDEGVLTLHRVNCDDIVIEGFADYVAAVAKETMDSYDKPFSIEGTEFNPETGILTIYINGNPYEVAGFLTNENFRVYVGYGLTGQGTIADPVRVSHINDTGFFAPVEGVIDYEIGDKLPDPEEGGDVSKRYITREQTSPYGLVYTYEAVKDIQNLLDAEDNGWRVPTFEDWADMLNGQEDCGDTNHGNTDEASQNGKIAGTLLKHHSWNEETAGNDSFNVLPIKLETFNSVTERDTKTASFWADTTSSADTHVYGKRFIGKRGTVETLGKGQVASNKLSLRLVRDIEHGAESDVEVIGGRPYETIQMKTYKEDELGNPIYKTSVWTRENVTFDEYLSIGEADKPCGNGYVLEDEDAFDDTANWAFYLNQWDNFDNRWVKKKLNPNDIVMVGEYSGRTNQEVIVKMDDNGDQVLKFRSEELFNELKPYVDEAIADEREERETNDQELWEAVAALAEELSAETIERAAEDDNLQGQIDALGDRISEVERTAVDGLEQEKTERMAADSALQGQIDTLSSGLQNEIQSRIDNDVKYGDYTANIGIEDNGVKIKSNDNEKTLNISFDANMGEITLLDY